MPKPITGLGGPLSLDQVLDMLAHGMEHKPRCTFECVYIRPCAAGFELVAQWVTTIGDDFTFDEEVLAVAATPHGLPFFNIGRDFEMPLRPSMR